MNNKIHKLRLIHLISFLLLLPEVLSAQGRIVESDSHRFEEVAEGVWFVGGNGSVHTMSNAMVCLLYTSPSPRDQRGSRMPSSA